LPTGDGLYLRVRPTGKAWFFRYKLFGKPAKISLGPYPTVSLAAARKRAWEETEKLTVGVDPRDARLVERERARVARCNTFELMARIWHGQAQKDHLWSAGASKVIRHLELHVFPWIGSRPMSSILPTELVRCLHRIKERGHLETAQRVREAVVHVYQYAVDVVALDPAKNFVNSKTGGLPAPADSPLRCHHRPRTVREAVARHPGLQRQRHHASSAPALSDAFPTTRAVAAGALGGCRPRRSAVALPAGEDEAAGMEEA